MSAMLISGSYELNNYVAMCTFFRVTKHDIIHDMITALPRGNLKVEQLLD